MSLVFHSPSPSSYHVFLFCRSSLEILLLGLQLTLCVCSIVFISPIAFLTIRWRTFIIFAATNLAIVPIIYFLYPETAYRSLEEVDVIFHIANEAPGNPWLNVVKISQNEPLWYGRKGDVPFEYERSDWHRSVKIWAEGREKSSGQGSGGSGSGSGSALWGSSTREKGHGSGSADSDETSQPGRHIGKAISSPEDETSGSSPEPHSPHSPNSGGSGSSSSKKKLMASQGKMGRSSNKKSNSHIRSPPSTTEPVTGNAPAPNEPWLYPPGPRSRSLKPWIPGRPVYVARGDSHDSTFTEKSGHSMHSDPEWRASELAPAPLRVSMSKDSETESGSNGRPDTSGRTESRGPVGLERTGMDEDGHEDMRQVVRDHSISGRRPSMSGRVASRDSQHSFTSTQHHGHLQRPGYTPQHQHHHSGTSALSYSQFPEPPTPAAGIAMPTTTLTSGGEAPREHAERAGRPVSRRNSAGGPATYIPSGIPRGISGDREDLNSTAMEAGFRSSSRGRYVARDAGRGR